MLVTGDVIEIKIGDTISADVPEHFVYANKDGSFDLVRHVVEVRGELEYFAGRYVVVDVTIDGGGCGHGPHDVYPDGIHIHCVDIENKRKIDFYQTGCFANLIEDVKPIGKATLEWSVE